MLGQNIGRVGLPDMSAGGRPSLTLDFVSIPVLNEKITFTRASTARYFDSSGVLTSAAIDAPRFDYNPSTLAARGLLIEEARTNSIRNNTMVGAVAGTPGTLPTNWQVFTSGGAATAVIGTGTENGISYVDVQFTGVASSSVSFFIDGTLNHAATNGQTWTNAAYYKLVAGSFTNVTANHVLYEADSAGTALAATTASLAAITGAALSNQRLVATRTNNNASTANVQAAITAVSTGASSFTLRIGLPQLEQGAFATSVIPTTTTALTRSADVASVNTLAPWYNSAAGTIYAEGVTNRPYTAATGGQMAQISDGTATNRMWIAQGNTTANTASNSVVTTGGALVAELQYGPVPSANLLNKSAFAYAANDFAGCVNGGTVQTDPSGAVPSATTLYLGISASLSSASNWNGYLRRITYYPRKLSSAELQAITA